MLNNQTILYILVKQMTTTAKYTYLLVFGSTLYLYSYDGKYLPILFLFLFPPPAQTFQGFTHKPKD